MEINNTVQEQPQEQVAQEQQEQAPQVQEQQPQPAQSQTQGVQVPYAGFFPRLGAMIIDIIIMTLVLLPVGFATIENGGIYFNTPGTIVMIGYASFMTAKFGATAGKMALKIRVQDKESGQNLSYGKAILRESVGKFLSAIALFVGYFWMIWDKNKQTWHDKITKSVVVKAN